MCTCSIRILVLMYGLVSLLMNARSGHVTSLSRQLHLFYHIYKSSDCIKSYPKANKIKTMQYFSVHVLLYQYLRMDGSEKKLII
jgi:hypothetical protein